MWAALLRRAPRIPWRWERLALEDGDFLDLAWAPQQEGPVVLLLHGLAGSARAPYVRGLAHALGRAGYRTVVMHFRGCSGTPNRLPQSYHAAHTGDLDAVATRLAARGTAPMAVVGFSIGASCLLHWLAQAPCPLAQAVAVSPPFSLAAAAERLDQGLSRLYQWHLLGALRKALRAKARAGVALPLSEGELRRLRDFRHFDDRVTAPLHGFHGVDDYYRRASPATVLHRIHTPTPILHARDDPFLPATAIPPPQALSTDMTLELSRHGGHVGFVTGPAPGAARYWLETRILRALRQAAPPP